MRALAWIRVHDEDEAVPLGHGDLIGRLPGAALRLDDPRISEAHALVSLRGERLMMLALRGRFRVGSRIVAEMPLAEGARVELAEGLIVEVVAVTLPEHVLALRLPGNQPIVLTGTTSVLAGPPAELVPGYRDDAELVVWAFDHGWRYTLGGGSPDDLRPGPLAFRDGTTVHVVETALANGAGQRTRSGLGAPLVVRLGLDLIILEREGHPPTHVAGIPGRLAHVLIDAGAPMPWREVVARVWEDDRASLVSLRRRLDTALSRLRTSLREAGVDPGRLETDGAGTLRFRLERHDRVEAVDGPSPSGAVPGRGVLDTTGLVPRDPRGSSFADD